MESWVRQNDENDVTGHKENFIVVMLSFMRCMAGRDGNRGSKLVVKESAPWCLECISEPCNGAITGARGVKK
jgi:hypothetical protein